MSRGPRTCVYCGGSRGARLSKEHVISRKVLQTVFGEDIRNFARSTTFGGRFLDNHEQTVGDVCAACNQDLSDYDVAGVTLVADINQGLDATGRILHLTPRTVGWLIKTHLNHVRLIADAETGEHYHVDHGIYRALLNQVPVPYDKYRLYIEGWQGADYLWNKDDPRKISFFYYQSVRHKNVEILVSNFRIKWLDTFLLLPADGRYEDFGTRCSYTESTASRTYGSNWQAIGVEETLSDVDIPIRNVVPLARILLTVHTVQ